MRPPRFRDVAALLAAAILGATMWAVTHSRPERPAVLSAIEIGFAQDMSVHHQQAVTMTDMLAPDATGDVKALAEQIRFTQLSEIGQMTGWLALAGAPPAGAQPMAWMMPPSTDHHDAGHDAMEMPGMATPTDLKRLQRSAGLANQNLFLHLMTRHHQGGISMAAYAFHHTTNDTVRRAASVMVDEQTQEIQIMATLLAQHELQR